jgi:polynucleotide 5'-hydroxyl-kinase GRC3/NOL9
MPSPAPDVAQRLSAQLRPYTSEFQPREGVNFTKLKKGALPAVLGGGSAVVVSLGEDETLAIAGTFTVVPLQHSISLLSTTLHPAEEDVESYPVFAPTCHPVPVITPGINPEQLACSPALEDVKLPKGFLRDASRAIFLLQENRTGIEGLTGDVVPGFNHIWAREVGAWGLVGVHPVTANFTPVYAHVTPPSWSDALASLEQAPPADDDEEDTPAERIPVVVVKGPKRSGKSSLARAALNRLLGDFARVAWLECDLGQGEFGPGGAVGLWLLDAPALGEFPSHSHADFRPAVHAPSRASARDISRRAEPSAVPRRVHGGRACRHPALPV